MLADGHLLTNAALAVEGNAQVLLELLWAVDDDFQIVDGRRAGGGWRSAGIRSRRSTRRAHRVIVQLLCS